MTEMNMNGARSQEPQHVEAANQFASELMDRFSLTEQNEILFFVSERILQTRQKRLEHLHAELEELKASVNDLAQKLSV